jgi:TetR/AcrR family transcriptional repressor of lmrAB and yxaGH operons
MAKDVRKRMVEGAARLLASRGLDATSFPEVLALTGASRGSVYHHFPGGRQELVHAAVTAAGDYLLRALAPLDGASAETVTRRFLEVWRDVLARSNFDAGCAVVAVAVAAESPEMLAETAAIFRAWRMTLAGLLERGGLTPAVAARFATTLIAATEGAVVLSRAEQSMESFELVAKQIQDEVKRQVAKRG